MRNGMGSGCLYKKTYITYPDYKINNNQLDQFIVQFTTQPTAKLGTVFLVGTNSRSFDNPNTKGGSGLRYEVSFNYDILEYSELSLNVGKKLEIPSTLTVDPSTLSQISNAAESQYANLSWGHDWSSVLKSNLSMGIISRDYTLDGRHDEVKNLSFKISQTFRYWLSAGFELSMLKQNSNVVSYNFDKNQAFFTLDFKL